MIVVADSSPFIVLIEIGHVDVLPALFVEVTVPPQVIDELKRPNRPTSVQQFMAAPPAWLVQRSARQIETIPKLHAGEVAAINLAIELRADLLLIDELEGRKAASQRQLRFVGTIGVIELAAEQGLLDLRSAFEKVKATDFWVSSQLLDARLQLFLSRKGPGSKST